MKLELSRPIKIILGVLAIVLLIALALNFVVFPAMGRGGGAIAARPTIGPPPPRTPHPWAIAGPTPTAHPWAITEPTPHPWAIAEPSAVAEESPEPATGKAAGPTEGPPPKGGGEQLPYTAGGVPLLIPMGGLLLVVVAWWRWRRTRAEQ